MNKINKPTVVVILLIIHCVLSFQNQQGTITDPMENGNFLQIKFNKGATCQNIIKQLSSIALSYPQNIVIGFGKSVKENCNDNAGWFIPESMMDFPRTLDLMPHDAVDIFIHVKTATRSAGFDISFAIREVVMPHLHKNVKSVNERVGFVYQRTPNGHGRDLSGFEDGTMNEGNVNRRRIFVVGLDGSSYMHSSIWIHDLKKWNNVTVGEQETVFGRTKVHSRPLRPLPHASHVDRTNIPKELFRQSMPYDVNVGGVKEAGLVFIAYTARLSVLDFQIRRMGGAQDGSHDKIFDVLTKMSGGDYHFVPNVETLMTLASKRQNRFKLTKKK